MRTGFKEADMKNLLTLLALLVAVPALAQFPVSVRSTNGTAFTLGVRQASITNANSYLRPATTNFFWTYGTDSESQWLYQSGALPASVWGTDGSGNPYLSFVNVIPNFASGLTGNGSGLTGIPGSSLTDPLVVNVINATTVNGNGSGLTLSNNVMRTNEINRFNVHTNSAFAAITYTFMDALKFSQTNDTRWTVMTNGTFTNSTSIHSPTFNGSTFNGSFVRALSFQGAGGTGSFNVGAAATPAVIVLGLSMTVMPSIIATNGYASLSSVASVAIDATGWTNIWSTNNAVVVFGGTTVSSWKKRAGALTVTNITYPIFTGNQTVILQPGQAIVISGTVVTGSADPF